MTLKRYLIFMFEYEDMKGGWNDLAHVADNYQEAKEFLRKYLPKRQDGSRSFWHIVDTTPEDVDMSIEHGTNFSPMVHIFQCKDGITTSIMKDDDIFKK